MKFLAGYNLLFFSTIFIWAVCAFITKPAFFISKNNYVGLILTYSFFVLFIPFINDNIIILNRHTSFISIPFYFLMYRFNSKYRNAVINLRIILISTLIIVYTTIQTCIELLVNPYASRSIKSSTEGTEELLLNGVSGYGLIYSVVLIVIAMTPLLIDRNKVFKRRYFQIVTISTYVLFLILILLSNYFTAFLVTFFGVGSIIIFYKNKRLIYFLLPIITIYFMFGKYINLFIIDVFQSVLHKDGLTFHRLEQLKYSIVYGSDASEINSRSDVIMISINTFMEFPWFGYLNNNLSAFNIDLIGQHSFIIDSFAFYGVFIGVLTIIVFSYPIYFCYKKYKHKVFSLVMLVSFLILLVLNNLTPSMGFVVFFIFPTILVFIKDER